MKKKTTIIILVTIIVIILGSVFYWQYRNAKIESNQPSITVISPNGGEILNKGSVYTIEWETKNIPETNKIAISIRRVAPPSLSEEGQEFDPIIFTDLENTGSKEWEVSYMYPDGNYIIEINAYDSLPMINPISDESDVTFQIITGWGSYTNEKGGYSFKYPKEWNAVTNKYNSKNTLFGPEATNESGHGGVEFQGTLLSDQSLKDFVKEFNKGVESGSVLETEETINGQNAIISILSKAALEPTQVKSVSFEKDGQVFNVYLVYKTDSTKYPEEEQILSVFDQILSTFQFAD